MTSADLHACFCLTNISLCLVASCILQLGAALFSFSTAGFVLWRHRLQSILNYLPTKVNLSPKISSRDISPISIMLKHLTLGLLAAHSAAATRFAMYIDECVSPLTYSIILILTPFCADTILPTFLVQIRHRALTMPSWPSRHLSYSTRTRRHLSLPLSLPRPCANASAQTPS